MHNVTRVAGMGLAKKMESAWFRDELGQKGDEKMRIARLKPKWKSSYVHLMGRVAGEPDWLPFGDVEKEHMIRLWKRLCGYYTMETISFCPMSNHWHAVVYVRKDPPSPEEAAERYNRYYKDKRYPLKPTNDFDRDKLKVEAKRMNNFSRLVSEFQQQFTMWYNRVRCPGRRGTLWADRFKSVLVDGQTALWNCIKYVEMNPVRAGIVEDPADYRFSTWGTWCSTGRHPFTGHFHKHLKRAYGMLGRNMNVASLDAELQADMARSIAVENGCTWEEIHQAEEDGREGPAALLRVKRRVRHWSDGVIIGSKLFVAEWGTEFYGAERFSKKRLDRLLSEQSELFSFRRLRMDR
ncbi:hypothetical protein BVY04_01750 [bacterium M21]|nr:hypothetical protein BVY04_01750 [bacterium M21]